MNQYRSPQGAVCPCEADHEVCVGRCQDEDIPSSSTDPTDPDLVAPWELASPDGSAASPAAGAPAGSPAGADRLCEDCGQPTVMGSICGPCQMTQDDDAPSDRDRHASFFQRLQDATGNEPTRDMLNLVARWRSVAASTDPGRGGTFARGQSNGIGLVLDDLAGVLLANGILDNVAPWMHTELLDLLRPIRSERVAS